MPRTSEVHAATARMLTRKVTAPSETGRPQGPPSPWIFDSWLSRSAGPGRTTEEPMKAVVLRRHGDAGVLELADMPEPKIGARDVLIRVKAVALNHLDVWVRRGIPGLKI